MVGTLIVTEGASPAEESPPDVEAPPASDEADPEGTVSAEVADESAGGEGVAAEDVTVTSIDIAFEPAEVTIPGGTDVIFHLPNDGAAPHNFSIDELAISIDQAPGESHDITINAPPGVYEYYCNVPGHREAGMVGTLTVE
jgi:plastocyanin